MNSVDIHQMTDTIQSSKVIIIGTGLVLAAIIFLLSKSKSKVDYYKNSALAGVGKRKLKCPLIRKDKLSHDTYKFVFGLPKEDQTLGINVGQHISIVQSIPTKDHSDGEEIIRKYTPTSPVTQKGSFELVIKVYRKNQHPRFPEGGILSQYMETLNVGDSIDITGPTGRLVYGGNGSVCVTEFGEAPKNKTYKKIFLVGGGTGITPLYQVVQAVASKTEDTTELYLLYGNKCEDDILIRQELEQQQSAGNLKLFYTLDTPPEGWKYYSGFVTKEMLEKTFPAYSKDTLICTCGPGPMNKLVLGLFKEMGYKQDQLFSF